MPRFSIARRRAPFLALLLISGLAGPAPTLAQGALCADPAKICGAQVPASCLAKFGAGSVAAADGLCAPAFERYKDCLAEAAETCGGDPSAASAREETPGCSFEEAQAIWTEAKADNNCNGYEAFVLACPKSRFALIAKGRLKTLGCGAGEEAATAPAAHEEPSSGATATSAPAALPAALPPTEAVGEAERRAAQAELRRLRLYRGGIDGDWGAGSQAAMRSFQSRSGLAADGALTLAGLAALRATPTPAAPKGYIGRYLGSWSNPSFGASGRSEFLTLEYDPHSGAIRGRMAIEYNGVVSQGVVTGTLTLRGGRMSGALRDSRGGGWNTALTLDPAQDFHVMTGSFYSTPAPGTFGVASQGRFTTRRVE
ncbi:MAG: peptidoglycan-binding domain-containing protein [Pseudomonadota bacterium]